MIAVIGGVQVGVDVRLMPPKRDMELQKKQDEEALRQAGIDPADPCPVHAILLISSGRHARSSM